MPLQGLFQVLRLSASPVQKLKMYPLGGGGEIDSSKLYFSVSIGNEFHSSAVSIRKEKAKCFERMDCTSLTLKFFKLTERETVKVEPI